MRARAWLVGVQVLTRGLAAPHEARCWEACGCAALKACMHGGREGKFKGRCTAWQAQPIEVPSSMRPNAMQQSACSMRSGAMPCMHYDASRTSSAALSAPEPGSGVRCEYDASKCRMEGSKAAPKNKLSEKEIPTWQAVQWQHGGPALQRHFAHAHHAARKPTTVQPCGACMHTATALACLRRRTARMQRACRQGSMREPNRVRDKGNGGLHRLHRLLSR